MPATSIRIRDPWLQSAVDRRLARKLRFIGESSTGTAEILGVIVTTPHMTSALASDVGDVQGEPGASSGKDTGRSRTGPFVEDEDAAGGVIWPT